jgi:hypothetical protein
LAAGRGGDTVLLGGPQTKPRQREILRLRQREDLPDPVAGLSGGLCLQEAEGIWPAFCVGKDGKPVEALALTCGYRRVSRLPWLKPQTQNAVNVGRLLSGPLS